jgi:hypothetical protein
MLLTVTGLRNSNPAGVQIIKLHIIRGVVLKIKLTGRLGIHFQAERNVYKS